MDFFCGVEAAIYYEVQVREILFQVEHPLMFQGRNRSILFGSQSFEKSFPCVHYELFNTSILANYTNKLDQSQKLIFIINTNPALYRHRYRHQLNHLLTNVGNQVRIIHQNSTKLSMFNTSARTATIYVHFVIAPTFYYFCCLGHLVWIITAKLKNNRVLIWCKCQ